MNNKLLPTDYLNPKQIRHSKKFGTTSRILLYNEECKIELNAAICVFDYFYFTIG